MGSLNTTATVIIQINHTNEIYNVIGYCFQGVSIYISEAAVVLQDVCMPNVVNFGG